MKSDFENDINIETTQEENCIDNIDKEFNKISHNNYSAQFESNRDDGWLDCGYMNDITNPYEVY
ncbi:MAG: hypothetical protein V7K18_07870 [Nostoc sp.]|uniref:hypothetical protein n=1 Tax=Nostoc sp. TaxID=1180 RepID=UPI002FFBDDDF